MSKKNAKIQLLHYSSISLIHIIQELGNSVYNHKYIPPTNHKKYRTHPWSLRCVKILQFSEIHKNHNLSLPIRTRSDAWKIRVRILKKWNCIYFGWKSWKNKLVQSVMQYSKKNIDFRCTHNMFLLSFFRWMVTILGSSNQ